MNKLFNPFRHIAGWESLAAGIVIIISTAVTGYFSHIHFPDLISVKTNPGFPILVLLVQCFSNWLIISILFYFSSLLLSSSSVRAIDIFGTQAMARFPYLLAAFTGFSGSLEKFGNYIIWNTFKTGTPIQISKGEITIALLFILLTLMLTVWTITLMFNAYKVSANIKGPKLVASFIIVVIVSIVVTGMMSGYSIKIITAYN